MCTLCVCHGCSIVACADSHLWGVVSYIKTLFPSATYIQDVLEHDIHHAADNLGLRFLLVTLSRPSDKP